MSISLFNLLWTVLRKHYKSESTHFKETKSPSQLISPRQFLVYPIIFLSPTMLSLISFSYSFVILQLHTVQQSSITEIFWGHIANYVAREALQWQAQRGWTREKKKWMSGWVGWVGELDNWSRTKTKTYLLFHIHIPPIFSDNHHKWLVICSLYCIRYRINPQALLLFRQLIIILPNT